MAIMTPTPLGSRASVAPRLLRLAITFHPRVILYGMGGGRAGQDPATAAVAIRQYFHPKVIVPMHIGTLPPPFATEADVRKAFRGDSRIRILVPGREVTF